MCGVVKMRSVVLILLAVAAVSAYPRQHNRIVGGSVTTIFKYPEMAALLWDSLNNGQFRQACGGTIVNNRSILTAAHCFGLIPATKSWRCRLGSSLASRGGQIFNLVQIITHPRFSMSTLDSDIAILRVQGTIIPSDVIRYGSIPGPLYDVPDNQVVWATGWGDISSTGPPSEQLRHVQLYTINLNICRQRYTTAQNNMQITDNMLCSGVLDVGGRDQCIGDSGGPLFHYNVIVGVCSFGPHNLCGSPWYPGVNTRVQRFTSWIIQNR